VSSPKPRKNTPDIQVELVGGGAWRLAEQNPENFTLVVAYRGLHCPICKTYLRDLNRNFEEFKKRGVDAIAISTDGESRAETARQEWELAKLPVGYGLSIDSAREWGLFISTGRGKTSIGIEEPEQFSEPGIFLIRPDKTLYASSIATMPFARPHFKDVLGAVEMIVEKNYPARGEA
jgi:peroxiredoxin